MNTQANVLQVFVSDYNAPSNAPDLASLPDGEIGFFDKDGNSSTTNGRIVMKRGDAFIESSYIKDFTGWGSIRSYVAPTYREETITVATATAGELYELSVELDMKNSPSKLIKKGVYRAQNGDTATDIASALVASINAAFSREDYAPVTVTNAAGVITIKANPLDYVAGKFDGLPHMFQSRLVYPAEDATLGTVTVPGNPGVGDGKYVHSKEFFAWGNNDSYRYNGWRNNFDPVTYSSPDGQYDVLALDFDDYVPNASSDVRTSLQILVAFDVNGAAPAPAP